MYDFKISDLDRPSQILVRGSTFGELKQTLPLVKSAPTHEKLFPLNTAPEKSASSKERRLEVEIRSLLTDTYPQLDTGDVPTRRASALAGVSRAIILRQRRAELTPHRSTRSSSQIPENKLTAEEEATILGTLDSERFVDQAPEQIYAILLTEGTYLCSVSTMYRLLRR